MSKKKDATLENTGERMIPQFHKGTFIYGEHVVRYEAAAKLVEGKVVLDIACGSGYGSQLLGKTAKKVYGVDIDEATVEYAQANYSRKNVTYLQGDAINIPLEDHAVDVVITFETIEHIERYQKFLQEIKRVLKPGGVAVISTPNDTEFSEGNHFHIHEFKHKELTNVLSKHFKYTKEYFQGTWIYNALLTEEHFTSEWAKDMPTLNTAPKPIAKSLYFYILCSDEKIDTEAIELGAISHHWSARDEQKAGEEINAYTKAMKEHIAALEAKDQHQKEVNDYLQSEIERLRSRTVVDMVKEKAHKTFKKPQK